MWMEVWKGGMLMGGWVVIVPTRAGLVQHTYIHPLRSLTEFEVESSFPVRRAHPWGSGEGGCGGVDLPAYAVRMWDWDWD